MSKVPVQKGEINPAQRTQKTTPHTMRVIERAMEQQMIRDFQTMTLETPKAGKK